MANMGEMSRRDLLRGAAAAGACLVLGPAGARGAAQPFNLGTITITWYPIFLYFLPVSVAIEKGFLREEGIEVKDIIGAKGGGETVRNLTEGNLPLGDAAAAASVLAIIRAKEPLMLVGGGTKSPGDISWIVLEDSPIRKIQDLKGKTMSYTSPGSVTEQLASMCLSRAGGINPEDVKRVSAGGIGEGLALLRKREVDACAMLEPTFTLRGAGTRTLFYARDLVPDYFQSFWLARKTFMQQHGDVLRGFLRARRRGLEYTLKNPREAALVWARLNKQPEDLAVKMLQASGVPQGLYHSDGRFVAAGLNTVEEGMRLSGDIEKAARIPWRQIVDQSFLDPAQRIELPA
jgi:NitT/TauT family transport system substrate-binding protein